VLVYGRVRPDLVKEKWSGSSRPECRELSCSGPIAGAFLQHDADGSLRLMVGYILALLAVYISGQWSEKRKWDYGTKL